MRKLVLALTVIASSVLLAPSAANAAPPSTATDVTARAGTNQATVSWTPASDAQGRNITYIATSTPGSRACVTSGSSCPVTGLSNGQAYTFKVTASVRFTNGDTSGTETSVSEASAPVTPRVDTVAPVLVSESITPSRVSSNGGYVTVELRVTDDFSGFADVTNLGNFTGPSIYVDAAGGKSISTFPSANRIAGNDLDGTYQYLIYVPPGTAPGVARLSIFPIRDKAGNSGNFGGTATFLVGNPAAPANVTATPTADRNATVSWAAPEDDGGNVITSYKVTEQPSGRTFTTDGNTTTVEVGLTEHPATSPLTYSVTATNAGGVSPTGQALPLIIPATAPTPVAKAGVVRGDKKVSVTWTAPSSTRGAALTGYTASASPGGQTCNTGPTALSCDITGLTNGTSYTVSVTATNSAGTSTPSPASDSATPAAAPAKLAAPTAVAAPNRATVTWAPGTPNGAPITGYKVITSPGGDTCGTAASDTSCVIAGLTNGTAYTFTVEAISDAGLSAPSNASTAITPAAAPGAPGAPSVTPGNGRISVSWPTASANGSPITGYTAIASPTGKTCTTDGAGRTCAITGLDNGVPYWVKLVATNAVGSSIESAPSVLVTPVGPPSPVGTPEATAGEGSATVGWDVFDTNGSPVTGYTVTASPGGQIVSVGARQTTTVVSNLSAGTSYSFIVTAQSAAGASDPSPSSNAVTPSAPPVPPAPPTPPSPPAPPAVPSGPTIAKPRQVAKPKAVAGKKSAKVVWKPAAANGAPVTGYRIVASNGKKVIVRANVKSVKFSGLKKGKKYTFTVTAINSVGSGKVSRKSTPVKSR